MDPAEKQVLPSRPTKKVYSRPQLQVYGDLRTITQSVGKTGKMDGGSPNPNHLNTNG
jgi:hypothetical protein